MKKIEIITQYNHLIHFDYRSSYQSDYIINKVKSKLIEQFFDVVGHLFKCESRRKFHENPEIYKHFNFSLPDVVGKTFHYEGKSIGFDYVDGQKEVALFLKMALDEFYNSNKFGCYEIKNNKWSGFFNIFINGNSNGKLLCCEEQTEEFIIIEVLFRHNDLPKSIRKYFTIPTNREDGLPSAYEMEFTTINQYVYESIQWNNDDDFTKLINELLGDYEKDWTHNRANELAKAKQYKQAAKLYEKINIWDEAGKMRELANKNIGSPIHVDIDTIDKSVNIQDSLVHKSQLIDQYDKFNNCPYCGKNFNLPNTPKYCPFCAKKLTI